jgi:hypothetical protein
LKSWIHPCVRLKKPSSIKQRVSLVFICTALKCIYLIDKQKWFRLFLKLNINKRIYCS